MGKNRSGDLFYTEHRSGELCHKPSTNLKWASLPNAECCVQKQIHVQAKACVT
jgi:hypothetical protein